MNNTPTPETDAARHDLSDYGSPVPCSWGDWIHADVASKLERERDEAIADRDIARLIAMDSDRAHDRMVVELEKVYKERDEVREKLNTNFEEISNKFVAAIRERDEVRERARELAELVDGAYILVELDKPQGEYNKKWRVEWMEKAKRLIPGVDSIWY